MERSTCKIHCAESQLRSSISFGDMLGVPKLLAP